MRRLPLLIILYILLLAGCGGTADFRDAAELLPIQTPGHDRSGDTVTLSASIGAGPEALPTAVLRGSGRSISEALDALRRSSQSEDLFFAHVRFVVVGGSAAGLFEGDGEDAQKITSKPLPLQRNAARQGNALADFAGESVTRGLPC